MCTSYYYVWYCCHWSSSSRVSIVVTYNKRQIFVSSNSSWNCHIDCWTRGRTIIIINCRLSIAANTFNTVCHRNRAKGKERKQIIYVLIKILSNENPSLTFWSFKYFIGTSCMLISPLLTLKNIPCEKT